MAQLPVLATPQEAKKVWDRQQRPSARGVARALTQAGRPVHFTTVDRWRRQGWPPGSAEHPVAQARAALDSAIPVLTRDPTSTCDQLLASSDEREELDRLSDRELIRRASRELAIAMIMCSRAVQRRANNLVSHTLAEASVLVLSLAKCFKAVVTGLDQVGQLDRQTSFFDKELPEDSGN
jgi:hypothetical protein